MSISKLFTSGTSGLMLGAITTLLNSGGPVAVRFVGLLLDSTWAWCLIGFTVGAFRADHE